jgi:acylphosphatase
LEQGFNLIKGKLAERLKLPLEIYLRHFRQFSIHSEKKKKMSQIKLRIYGKVQGVFFRNSTRKKARELGLSGWVRNESDGSVTAVAQGKNEAVKQLTKWCHEGPPEAEVSQVKVESQEEGDLDDFTVKN